ncbi:MAG: iron complex outerrane recepter protein, partial [Gammaproteobacteria bacterium]|nr:iron complex outerrane recepter protein [Gammaproteobacteria bacterium]
MRRPFFTLSVLTWLALLSAASPAADTTATPADGSPVDADPSGLDGQLATVTVTARNRAESAQEVPIPMSVLQSSDLVRDNTVNIQDLTQKAPGLEATTPNSRRTGISMRGIGKSAGNDALEASVGVLVDGIFLSHPGMTYQDFTDLDQVEVLRGPQGTLLGKNTTIGALSFNTKAPSFSEGGSATFTAGERNAHSANAAFGNSIIDDLLAYRVSAFVDKQDGFITNVNAEGGTTNERNRAGTRLQLLLTPFPGFSARINADYAESNERSNTKPIIGVLSTYDNAAQTPRVTTPGGLGLPTTAAQVALQNTGTNTYTSIFNRAYFGGYQPIVGSWDEEDLNLNVPVITLNQGISST